jgi:hypothetical protein
MKKYVLLSLILGIALSTYSCKDDRVEKTVDEDKEMLIRLSADMVGDLDGMAGASGMDALKALVELMDIQDPLFETTLKSTASFRYKSLLFPSFDRKSMNKSAGVNGFDLEGKVGTYTWSAEFQGWVIMQNNPADKIVIIYPTGGPASPVNNAALTLHQLSSQTFQDEWDSWEQPLTVKADLYVSDIRVIEIDMAVIYKSDGEPSDIDLYLMVSPYALSLSFGDTGSVLKIDAVMAVNDIIIMSADIDLDYVVETDIYSGDDETIITFINGYVHYGSIKVSGTINSAALDGIEDVSVNDLNSYVNLRLDRFPGGQKIADIDFVEIEPGDIEPRLTFNDGTTALAKDYFKPVADALEARVQEFIEDWQGEEEIQ